MVCVRWWFGDISQDATTWAWAVSRISLLFYAFAWAGTREYRSHCFWFKQWAEHVRDWLFLASRKWQGLGWGMEEDAPCSTWDDSAKCPLPFPSPRRGLLTHRGALSTWAQMAAASFQQSSLDGRYQMIGAATGDEICLSKCGRSSRFF